MTKTTTPMADQLPVNPGHRSEFIGPGFEGAQHIPVNMYETSEAIVIVAPMPGVTPAEVEITVQTWRVHLMCAQRTPAAKEYLLHEWEYGLYERWLDLPSEFCGPVTATLGNGQLAVSIGREGERGPNEKVVVHPVNVPKGGNRS